MPRAMFNARQPDGAPVSIGRRMAPSCGVIMSEPKLLRRLTLAAPEPASGRAHVSAASALVRVAERLYVAADDELQLGVFELGDERSGHLLPLFDGELPADAVARKAAKPDLE